MRTLVFTIFLSLVLVLHLQSQELHHYVFFNRDHERIAEESFLDTRALEGAQLKYTWRELEPQRDQYDFSSIQNDLDVLRRHGKRLFVQVQDVSFDTSIHTVPKYIESNEFHGGVESQFETTKGEKGPTFGWVARRWDPVVQERQQKLFRELGKEFDGEIEGINLPETAIDFGTVPEFFPEGFSYDRYRDVVVENMKVLKEAFPRSHVIIYSNFMPGDHGEHPYLTSIYLTAKEHQIGLGGPDLLPYKEGQMRNGYRFMRMIRGSTDGGVAVQHGNLRYINPRTKKQVTIGEMIEFAKDYLGVKYIFWGTEEPYYSRDLVPFLNAENR